MKWRDEFYHEEADLTRECDNVWYDNQNKNSAADTSCYVGVSVCIIGSKFLFLKIGLYHKWFIYKRQDSTAWFMNNGN